MNAKNISIELNDKLSQEEYIMKTKSIRIELEARYDKARSAWARGVLLYADELLDNVWNEVEVTEKNLLNGAKDWQEYSEGGCSLIYDEDICYRLCAPWQIRRKRRGDLPPNRHETWLDVQARALHQAAQLLISIING